MLLFHAPVGYQTPPPQVVPTIRTEDPLYEVDVKCVPIVFVPDASAPCPLGSAPTDAACITASVWDPKQTSDPVSNTPSSTPVTSITQCCSVPPGRADAPAWPTKTIPLAMTTAIAAIP